MLRDTDFTIEDILDGAELSKALHEFPGSFTSTPDTSATLKSLRFIKIPPTFQASEESDIVFEITESGDYPEGIAYIAVSYCWNSFSRQKQDIGRIVSVVDRGVTRKPRCSAQVLLRAAGFAAQTRVSHVWIDQECIDQTDSKDVQKHLQCMHEIFENAKMSIGLLNFEIINLTQGKGLMMLSIITTLKDHISTDVDLWLPILVEIEWVEFCTRLLKSLYKDPWFSRTWVFQERFSGFSNMHLLFKTSPEIKDQLARIYPELFRFPNRTNQLSLTLKDLAWNPAMWLLLLKEVEFETPQLRTALENLHTAAERMLALLQGFTLDNLMYLISNQGNLAKHDYPMDGFFLKSLFHSIEACDNEVVSDRVAILSNIACFPYRLDTHDCSSYSISLLALLIVNKQIPFILFRANIPKSDKNYHFVTFLSISDVAEWLGDIGGLPYTCERAARNNHLTEDIKATTQALTDFDPEMWSRIVTEKGNMEAALQKIEASEFKCAVIVPEKATIQEIIDGIISRSSKGRAQLNHTHGMRMLRYAIGAGQVPNNAEFVSFYGNFCWRAEFVEKHFPS